MSVFFYLFIYYLGHIEPHELRAIQLHYIREKRDIYTSELSKTGQLTQNKSRWINVIPKKRVFDFWVNCPFKSGLPSYIRQC